MNSSATVELNDNDKLGPGLKSCRVSFADSVSLSVEVFLTSKS